MKIIGLAGKSKSGKDTVAQIIMGEMESASTFTFAEALKSLLYNIAGKTIPDTDKDLPQECFKNRSLGVMCQIIGQAIRTAEPDFFASKLTNILNAEPELKTVNTGANYGNVFFNRPSLLIVTDVRYINEAETVRNLGGKIIRIHRNVESLRPKNHASETEMDSVEFRSLVNYDLYNVGDLKQLTETTKNLLKHVFVEG